MTRTILYCMLTVYSIQTVHTLLYNIRRVSSNHLHGFARSIGWYHWQTSSRAARRSPKSSSRRRRRGRSGFAIAFLIWSLWDTQPPRLGPCQSRKTCWCLLERRRLLLARRSNITKPKRMQRSPWSVAGTAFVWRATWRPGWTLWL